MANHHWHAMNGSSGCLPDNNEIHPTKKDAAKSMASLFDSERGVYTTLMLHGIYYFADPGAVGADYCEIACCNDEDCTEE